MSALESHTVAGNNVCVFPESRVHSATTGKDILSAKTNPMFSDGLDSMFPDSGALPVACLGGHLETWRFFPFSFFIGNEHIGDQNPLNISIV